MSTQDRIIEIRDRLQQMHSEYDKLIIRHARREVSDKRFQNLSNAYYENREALREELRSLV